MWQSAISADGILPYNIEGLVTFPPCLPTSEAVWVRVPITSPKPRPSSPQPSDYLPSEALSLREAMIRDRQAAMQRRDMRAVHEIEADIRAVTMAMLGRGN